MTPLAPRSSRSHRLTLGQKQEFFAEMLPRLIDKAHALGFAVRVGEVERSRAAAEWNATHCRVCKKSRADHTPDSGHEFAAIGIRNSLHCDRLAIDLLLFRDGRYLTDTESYREIGEWWERQDHLCRWGGRFDDGGHFSVTHSGRA